MRIAERQFGVVSTAQMREVGIDRREAWRLVGSGRWERLLPGVFRLVGVERSWRQSVMAATLWGGPLAVASHLSAARLWDLDGDWGDSVEVTLQYAMTNERVHGPITHRTRRLAARDRSLLGPVPVTRVERTLIDLTGRMGHNDLEIAMESALRRYRTSVARLWQRVDAHPGRHLHDLRRLLETRQPEAAQSRWEARLLQLIRDAGLPEPVRQYRVWDGDQWRFIDLAYPRPFIGLEYDSYRWHSGRQAWERGHTRNAGLVAMGWRMLPITMDDVDITPKRTISRIRALREAAAA